MNREKINGFEFRCANTGTAICDLENPLEKCYKSLNGCHTYALPVFNRHIERGVNKLWLFLHFYTKMYISVYQHFHTRIEMSPNIAITMWTRFKIHYNQSLILWVIFQAKKMAFHCQCKMINSLCLCCGSIRPFNWCMLMTFLLYIEETFSYLTISSSSSV